MTTDNFWNQFQPVERDAQGNLAATSEPATEESEVDETYWSQFNEVAPQDKSQYLEAKTGNSEEARVRKESEDLVLEAIREIPLQFGPWKSEDTKLVDIIGDEAAAWMVGAGHRLQDVYRGGKQMLGVDIDEEREAERLMSQLYQHDDLGGSATVGGVVGSIAEPAGFLVPGAKGKSVWELVKAGMKIGGITGAASYVDEESGQTRLGNAVGGVVFGTAGGAAVAGIGKGVETVSSAVRKALKLKPSDDLMQAKHMFEREVAERKIASPEKSWQQAWDEARSDFPKLYGKAKQAAEETGEAIQPLKMARDLDVYKAEEANIPIDTIAPSSRKSFAGRAMNSMDRILGIISTRIKNIDKRTFGSLRTLEANLKLRPEKYADIRKDFSDLVPTSRMSGREFNTKLAFTKEQTRQLNKLLVNNKRDEARDFILNLKGQEAVDAFNKSLKVIDELGDEMIKWGVIDKKIDNYWPRAIEYGKVDEFKEFLNSSKFSDKAKGWWSEETNIHNITMAKKRKITEIGDDMIEFYENPIEALDSYIHHAVKEIEMAKFFGKESYAAGLKNKANKEGVFNLEKTIDHWAKNNPNFKNLDPDDKKELLGLIHHRFTKAEEGASEFISSYKAFVSATLLANPISAMTQLSDLANSMYKNGLKNTLSVVFKPQKLLKMKEMGLDINRFYEFEDIKAGPQKVLVDKLFKASGFHWADKLGKETFVDAAMKRALKVVDNLESRAGRRWSSEQREFLGGEGYAKLVRDLKTYAASPSKENLTDEIRIYLLGQLAEVQPIYASELTQVATQGSGGKFMFTLKSFMMKQLDIIRNDATTLVEAGLKNNNKAQVAEGMTNLVAYMYALGSMNVSVDYLKDLVLGKEKLEDAPEAIQRALTIEGLLTPFASFAKVFGLNNYTLQSLGWGDPERFVSDLVAPPIPASGEAMRFVQGAIEGDITQQRKELTNLSRYLPLIGRWWAQGQVAEIEVPQAGEMVYGKPPVAGFAEGGEVVQPQSTTDIQNKLDAGIPPNQLGVGEMGDAPMQTPTAPSPPEAVGGEEPAPEGQVLDNLVQHATGPDMATEAKEYHNPEITQGMRGPNTLEDLLDQENVDERWSDPEYASAQLDIVGEGVQQWISNMDPLPIPLGITWKKASEVGGKLINKAVSRDNVPAKVPVLSKKEMSPEMTQWNEGNSLVTAEGEPIVMFRSTSGKDLTGLGRSRAMMSPREMGMHIGTPTSAEEILSPQKHMFEKQRIIEELDEILKKFPDNQEVIQAKEGIIPPSVNSLNKNLYVNHTLRRMAKEGEIKHHGMKKLILKNSLMEELPRGHDFGVTAPIVAKIKNPLEVPDLHYFGPEEMIKALRKKREFDGDKDLLDKLDNFLSEAKMVIDDIAFEVMDSKSPIKVGMEQSFKRKFKEEIKGERYYDALTDMVNADANRRLQQLIKSHGYDGLKYTNINEGVGDFSYIVFDRDQIRYADEWLSPKAKEAKQTKVTNE